MSNIGTKSHKKAYLAIIGLVAVGLLSGCAGLVRSNYSQNLAQLRSGAYTLDPEHAYITFRVGHFGLSTIVGRFNGVTGTLDFDPNDIEAMSLQGIIEASSIDVNNTDLEERLRGDDWFNAQSFPQIIFTSTAVTPGEGDNLLITGELSMLGVSKELVLLAKFNGGADVLLTGKYTLGFSGNTQLKRSDFGMDGFAALIGDDIEVELHGEFQRN